MIDNNEKRNYFDWRHKKTLKSKDVFDIAGCVISETAVVIEVLL